MQMPASNYVKVVHALMCQSQDASHSNFYVPMWCLALQKSGSAVMWTIFSSHSNMVPAVIRALVIQAYDVLPNKLPDGENPIEQRTLTISGEEIILG
jgi:hypothetical protein